ncbi:hypothetical protein Golob_007736, partial [Gossypium lobatum]|nr:hypothetical protein [Gossypium lobatum]
ELSQLDAKLDAKLKATFKEFKDEFKEKLYVIESVDKDIASHKTIKPSSIESTPFQLLKEVKDLELATTLHNVDEFALRIHIGPYFREVFKDSMKKEAMHRADWDILWLQRDFNIHLCNLLDIRKAARVLKLEQNSLDNLLQNYCGVTAKNEY